MTVITLALSAGAVFICWRGPHTPWLAAASAPSDADWL